MTRGERTTTVDRTDDADGVDAADEAKFRRMIDYEEELLEERREERVADSPSAKPSEDDAAAETIRTVDPKGRRLTVEFFVDGSVETDTLPKPEDPTDPNEPLVRLCRLCGVEPGRVTQLQGEQVPLVTNTFDDYEIHLPETATRPAIRVYRAWWWLRRRGVDLDRAKIAGKGAVVTVLYLGSMWLNYLAFFTPFGKMTPSEGVGFFLPFTTPAATSGSPVAAVVGFLLMIAISILGAVSLAGTVIGVSYALYRGVQSAADRTWPF